MTRMTIKQLLLLFGPGDKDGAGGSGFIQVPDRELNPVFDRDSEDADLDDEA